MASARAQAAPADLHRVGLYMTKLNVQGLPRNYQLFHEALFGLDRSLGAEIAALGPNPPQHMLDEIGIKYRLVSHCGLVAETSQTDAARMLREVAAQLSEGLKKRHEFVQAVESVKHSSSRDDERNAAALVAEMDFLHASLSNLMIYETELTERLKTDSDKLDLLDRRSATAQTAAVTDRITGLPNQFELVQRLTELYDSDSQEAALVLVDLDDFRGFNRKYGSRAANQMLRKLGALCRKTVKKEDFVARVGDDEFGFLFTDVDATIARTIANRLKASIEESMVYATPDRSDPGRLTVSLGIAHTDDARSGARLMAHAQAALVTARSDRRRPVHLFVPE